MKFKVDTQIEIPTSSDRIWEVLTHWEGHNDWNPLLKDFKGTPEIGKRFHVKVNKMTFKPIMKCLEQRRKLEWLGSLFFKGLFDGQHTFEIIPINSNQCLFKQTETFSGLLLPLLKKRLSHELPQQFMEMNEALKKECLK